MASRPPSKGLSWETHLNLGMTRWFASPTGLAWCPAIWLRAAWCLLQALEGSLGHFSWGCGAWQGGWASLRASPHRGRQGALDWGRLGMLTPTMARNLAQNSGRGARYTPVMLDLQPPRNLGGCPSPPDVRVDGAPARGVLLGARSPPVSGRCTLRGDPQAQQLGSDVSASGIGLLGAGTRPVLTANPSQEAGWFDH